MTTQGRVVVTERNEIRLPQDTADRLNLRAGDRLLVDVQNGVIVLTPEPTSYTERLAGLHRAIWAAVDTDEYLRKLRDDWTEQ